MYAGTVPEDPFNVQFNVCRRLPDFTRHSKKNYAGATPYNELAGAGKLPEIFYIKFNNELNFTIFRRTSFFLNFDEVR